MSKAAICPRMGKPHRWRIYPKKSIKYRIKNDRKIVYRVYELAICCNEETLKCLLLLSIFFTRNPSEISLLSFTKVRNCFF
jgi:hypothetical protein